MARLYNLHASQYTGLIVKAQCKQAYRGLMLFEWLGCYEWKIIDAFKRDLQWLIAHNYMSGVAQYVFQSLFETRPPITDYIWVAATVDPGHKHKFKVRSEVEEMGIRSRFK